MDSQFLLTSFIAVLALLRFLTLFIKKSSKQNTPLPPGPKGLPVFGNLFSLDPELHTYFSSLALKYGPIYKLKLGQKIGIVISSPTLAKQVLKDQDTTFANRDVPVAGREATYGGFDIVWTPYGPEWRMLRKVCVREMLSSKTLDGVYDLRRRELRGMITYLHGQTGSQVNVGEQMFLTVLNVITNMLWGGSVKGEERASIGAEFKQVVGEMTALLGMPNFSDFYPWLERFDLQGIQKKMKVLARRFDKIFDTIIDQRQRNGDGSGNDFLQVLLQLKDEGDAKTQFTMIHVKALLMDMVVGGSDTTSNTIEFALAEMMNKHAVMKETLRLHPALPLLVPHSPSETCHVGGYRIPEGARVFVNVWAIHRDPLIWENPLEFCPERFLDGKWDYSGNDFTYFPFGSGRRICAGISMGYQLSVRANFGDPKTRKN